jgi:hypothetical protein
MVTSVFAGKFYNFQHSMRLISESRCCTFRYKLGKIIVLGSLATRPSNSCHWKIRAIALMMEAVSSSESSFYFYQTTRRNITRRRESLSFARDPLSRTSHCQTSRCCSWGRNTRFEPLFGDRLCWMRVFIIFLNHSRKTQGHDFKIGHSRFLAHFYQLIISTLIRPVPVWGMHVQF